MGRVERVQCALTEQGLSAAVVEHHATTATPCDVVIDASLRRFDEVWAAAGSTHALFPAATVALAAAVDRQRAATSREPA